MSVNKVILIGRLGKDPEMRQTTSDKNVTTFSLATTSNWGDNEETCWHNIVCWNKTAELAKEYLAKGRQVYIEGRISNRSYDDKEGNKKYISEVVADRLTFLGSKSDSPAEPTGNYDGDPPI